MFPLGKATWLNKSTTWPKVNIDYTRHSNAVCVIHHSKAKFIVFKECLHKSNEDRPELSDSTSPLLVCPERRVTFFLQADPIACQYFLAPGQAIVLTQVTHPRVSDTNHMRLPSLITRGGPGEVSLFTSSLHFGPLLGKLNLILQVIDHVFTPWYSPSVPVCFRLPSLPTAFISTLLRCTLASKIKKKGKHAWLSQRVFSR